MKIFPSLILSLIFLVLWGCSDSGEPKLDGCTDSAACGYSIENTHDDGSCWTPSEGCSCSELTGAVVDECGVCGGSGPIDVNHDCDGSCIVSLDICGTCGGDEVDSNNCCTVEGQVKDCAGDCGGTAMVDCNGDCGGSAVEDCAGTCGGTAVKDNCEVCEGDDSTCVNFSTEIKPLFSSCTGCHGGYGGLSLSSYTNLMTGGNSGAVVTPGDGSGSLLVKKLRGTAGEQMPKDQDPLNDTTINLIETWINEGAKDN